MRGFWDELKYPAVALAPMDGVTDAAFRYIVCKYSRPAFTMTEFTNVEGLARGATKMLKAFIYHDSERPAVAQIYGVEVESYYKATVMLAAMGFDGVDINMGCPANNVAKRGSGAGLIRTPDLAREIIRACKRGARDFANGISLEEAGVHPDMIGAIDFVGERKELPISVKTRIGYDKVVAEEWTAILLEEKPANITMHGRTLKQMYTGLADWEEIGKAAALCKGSGTTLLGNGDVQSMADALARCEQYGVDGVLIGRAAQGNPWLFREEAFAPTQEEMIAALLDHCRYFVGLGQWNFHHIKKHLAWYCKGFGGARELRMALMQTNNLEEVEAAVKSNR